VGTLSSAAGVQIGCLIPYIYPVLPTGRSTFRRVGTGWVEKTPALCILLKHAIG
jgi:hypothetical protein